MGAKTEQTANASDKRAYWAAHVRAWRASGLSQTEYCRREGLNRNLLSQWKGKLEGGRRKRKPEVEFVEVQAPEPEPQAEPAFEVAIGPGGITIRLNLSGAWNWRPGQ